MLSCDCIVTQRVNPDDITEADMQDLALVHAYTTIKSYPDSVRGFYELQLAFEYLYNGDTVDPVEAQAMLYKTIEYTNSEAAVAKKLKEYVDEFIRYYGILKDRKDVVECYYYAVANARKFCKFESAGK